MHVVGARYLYSYVPYDRWAEQILGVNISQAFSFERNHYDRLVHFGFGLLIAWPAREVVLRYIGAPRRWSYYLVVDFIIAALIDWKARLRSPADGG